MPRVAPGEKGGAEFGSRHHIQPGRVVLDSVPTPAAPTHLFSVDVEEHFQVTVFERVAPPDRWDDMPSRVERNTDLLLDLLARHSATSTFFTVGWVAERHPALVRRIVDAGHELGSHGWWHRRVSTQTPDQFRAEVRDTKALLENQTGTAVTGFRAPSFSIRPGGEWALDVLLEEGYRYDSSLFPIRRPDYGYPAGRTVPWSIVRPAGTLLEIPPATLTVAGLRLPAAGGGYLRHFPLGLLQHAFRRYGRQGQPGMFYVHPWEVDPDQPRLPASWITARRHYGGLARTMNRLGTLLGEFRFESVAAWRARTGA